jgi:hypothetical protein
MMAGEKALDCGVGERYLAVMGEATVILLLLAVSAFFWVDCGIEIGTGFKLDIGLEIRTAG